MTGYYQVIDIINGILAGLVAITACAHLASPFSAMVVGAIGYLAYLVGKILLIRWRIDDAIEAVPVHLFAGIAGTLAVAFLVEEALFWQQFKTQTIGIFFVGLLTFTVTYIMLKIINHFYALRVSEAKEILGLNISEHQASTSMFDLARAMNAQAQDQDFSKKIMVEPYSDASLIATYYNHVTQAFNQLNDEKEALIEESYHMANYDQLTGLAKRRLLVNELSRSILRLDRQDQTNAILFIDLDGFKAINDQYGHNAGDILLKEAANRIQTIIRKTDLAARFGGDEFVILLENIQNESFAAQVADKIIHSIKQPIQLPNDVTGCVNASIGLKVFDGGSKKNVDDILNMADKAMYEAKRRGKGQWVIA